nr:putative ribonuclease H-like domain-containing protein [Tanacetum cinerariifolium]
MYDQEPSMVAEDDEMHQMTPKECHLHGVKRIFRYLKVHLKLRHWYPKESPFILVAYSDSDYGGATQDRKSAIEGSASSCGQVLWIQNQLLDYGIETTNEGTKILATVDGKPRTISESSIRRNLKLKDEVGISSLPDAELFKNLTLMGYNISPNQKFSFQKGQFSHQWKYLIHTIMQCLSPKSTGFNDFSSNIATALVCLATNKVYNFSKMIFDGMVRNVSNKVSKFLMYPRFIEKCLKMSQFGSTTHSHTHTVPFHTRKIFTTLRVNIPSFLGRTVPLFPTMLVTIGEGSGTPTEPYHTPSPEAPQSPQHDLSSLIHLPVSTATIPTVIPTDTPPLRQYTRRARIAQSSDLPTVADEPASPFRDDSQGEACTTVSGLEAEQDMENIIKTSTLPYDSPPRVTSLAVDEGSMQHKLNELTDLCTAYATSVLSSGVQVSVLLAAAVATISVPPAIISVPTSSDVVPTVSPIFTTTIVATPYSRRKGKEKMVESETPKKKSYKNRWMCKWLGGWRKKWQEMLREYEQVAAELTIRDKIDLINEFGKYQDHLASILKYKAQQSKPLSKKQQREFFWKQIEDFVPMGSKEEGERFKRKGLSLEQVSAKKVKTSEEVSKEDLKTMMQLVPVKEVYVEALQHFDREDLNQLWALVKETLNIRQATSDKEKELWTLPEYYEKVGISHETSVARSPQQNGVVERRNHMLIEAARTMLIYAKALLFLWAETVATTCYTQNHSIIRLRYGKTPYELLHDKLPDLSFFYVIVALKPAVSTGSPSSTTVDQDVPSSSNSQTTPKTQSLIISNDVEEENHDLDVAHMNNDLFFGIPILKNDFESSSSNVIPTIKYTAAPNSEFTK